ncbi:MAG: hypothetical protein AAF465_06965 [Pseudomonadota bacterium]
MKHAGIVLAFLLCVVAVADDNRTSDSLDLTLSKSLTLDPSGEKPDPVPTLSASDTAPVEYGAQPASSSNGIHPGWLAVFLLALPFMFWLGKRQQQHAVADGLLVQTSLRSRIDELKEAVIESGSGPREEWQSTLATLQSQLREKSTYIDQLHDSNGAFAHQVETLEQSIETQHEVHAQIEKDHATTLVSETTALSEKLLAEFNDAQAELQAQLKVTEESLTADLEATTAEFEQRIETIEQARDDAIESLKREHQAAIGALEQERDGAVDNTRTAALERDELQAQLEKSDAALDAQQAETARVSDELMSLQSDRESNVARIESLSADNAKLDAALAERGESLSALQADHTQLEQSLQTVRNEVEELKTAHAEECAALNQTANETRVALTEEVDARDQTIQARDAKIMALSEELVAAQSTAQADAEERDIELAAMNAQLEANADAESQLKTLEQEHEKATRDLAERAKQMDKLNAALAESRHALADLEPLRHDLELRNQELDTLKTVVSETDAALIDARAQVEQLGAQQVDIDALKAQLTAATEQLEKESKRADDAQQTCTALQEKIGQRERENTVLRNNLRGEKEDNATKKQALEQLEKNVEELESTLEIQQLENTQTLAALDSATDQTAELEARVEHTDLLDTHIVELEQQLEDEKTQRSKADARLSQTTIQQKSLIEQQAERNASLEKELESLKLAMANRTQSNEHLKKTLDQARKYRDELEENTRDLERENRELSKSSSKIRHELDQSRRALQDSAGKLGDRDEELQNLRQQLGEQNAELDNAHTELESVWKKVDELTTAIDLMENEVENQQHTVDQTEIGQQLEQTRAELNKRTRLLSEMTGARDEHERNANALKDQLDRAQNELNKKNSRVSTLGSQLVALNEQREQHLAQISELSMQVQDYEAMTPAPQLPPPVEQAESLDEALRARENIIAALEKEVQRADVKMAGLQQKLDDLEMASRAEAQGIPDGESLNAAQIDSLKQSLVDKSRLAQSLSNELKATKDLVKVFENDSNMLHDTEVELTSKQEHNDFLEHELAKAVVENKTLKNELEKAAKRLARHQNIGRTVSEDTRVEQLQSRLSALESENREQLEMIAQLRSGDAPQG